MGKLCIAQKYQLLQTSRIMFFNILLKQIISSYIPADKMVLIKWCWQKKWCNV